MRWRWRGKGAWGHNTQFKGDRDAAVARSKECMRRKVFWLLLFLGIVMSE